MLCSPVMRISTNVATTRMRPWLWILVVTGILLALVGAWATSWPSPITAVDVQQKRINTALPAPQNQQVIEQTILPTHNGLTEIELIVVSYQPTDEPATADSLLVLRLLDSAANTIVEQQYNAINIKHNQTITLRFPPQTDSAGKQYTLQLTGTEGNKLSVWGYSLAPRDQTALNFSGIEGKAQVIYYVGKYQLNGSTAASMMARDSGRYGVLILLLLLFIFLPGLLIVEFIHGESWDVLTYWGIAFTSGLASWPILWLWMTVLGGRFTGWLLWLLFIVGWSWWFWRQWQNGFQWMRMSPLRLAAFLLLLLITFIVRFLAIRDLSFLPWVDASRHALITAVTIQSGQFLQNYEPYLPIQQPIYHFGFHTIPASLQLMTNSFWPLEMVLLVTMQTLSGLMPLAVYSGTRLLTKHRGAAWLAAFLVALPFFFPAYYTTWGRLTQITGGLIMATLIGLTWQIGRGLNSRRLWPLVGLLAAGLFLIHFRVFSFYVPLVIWVFLISIVYKRPRPLILAGIVGGGLILPRLFQLLQPRITPLLTNTNIPENYNNFPTGYLTTGWEQFFWIIAAVGVVFLIGQSISQRGGHFAALSLALWMGLLFLLTAGELVGLPILLPQTNLNSMYISLFVPEAMLIGVAVGQAWQLIIHRHWLVDVLAHSLAGAALTLSALFGIHEQIGVLNTTTFLARTADLPAIQWLDNHVPADAYIAVNSWEWLSATWAGSDAGAWILPLTGRLTTTPPIDYTLDRTLTERVQTFNELANALDNWSTPAAMALLRGQGVTHIYVGRKGGYLDPAELAANPDLEMIYAQDGVFIFALKP